MIRILLIIAVVLLLLFLFHRGNTQSFFGNYYSPTQDVQGQAGVH